jgi:hypothetical protein
MSKISKTGAGNQTHIARPNHNYTHQNPSNSASGLSFLQWHIEGLVVKFASLPIVISAPENGVNRDKTPRTIASNAR